MFKGETLIKAIPKKDIVEVPVTILYNPDKILKKV